MNVPDFYKLSDRVLARADKIMKSKMDDYAVEADCTDNFHRTGERFGILPTQVWGVFADKHWGAVNRHARDGRLESEDLVDRLCDVINYVLLYAGLNAELIEEQLNVSETDSGEREVEALPAVRDEEGSGQDNYPPDNWQMVVRPEGEGAGASDS